MTDFGPGNREVKGMTPLQQALFWAATFRQSAREQLGVEAYTAFIEIEGRRYDRERARLADFIASPHQQRWWALEKRAQRQRHLRVIE
jgi:hypothetical protein